LRLPGQIIVPAEPWFGSALHCSIIGRAQTQRDAAPAFSSHQSVVLGVYVVVVAGLARRIETDVPPIENELIR
jgi:hypothetical protein